VTGAGAGAAVDEFVRRARHLQPDVLGARGVFAAVLVEPIQAQAAYGWPRARFMRQAAVADAHLRRAVIFDEVQNGWGDAPGRMWAHELFDLPSPPTL
jgi:4-aminobutyrate aminotransferase-like enzyme